ncbi:MAG: GntR family transcriptional regulator [Candidatus Aminicenantes bacterium]|nr:GntR family transcriptional regulator [Candidatus Aminicenantes bacterium]
MNLRLKSNFTGIIYDHIKKLICEGKLKPGQRVTVQEFANYFNVSITPVREALNRLLAENYLTSESANRNELRVINVTSKEINEIYELFRALDIFGLRKNLNQLPDALLYELSEMHKALGSYYEKRQLKAYFRQNYLIHSTIWKACQNDFIYKTMIAAQNKILIFMSLFPELYYSPEILRKSFSDHCELMDGLKARNIIWVEKILERHWGEGFFPDTNSQAALNK